MGKLLKLALKQNSYDFPQLGLPAKSPMNSCIYFNLYLQLTNSNEKKKRKTKNSYSIFNIFSVVDQFVLSCDVHQTSYSLAHGQIFSIIQFCQRLILYIKLMGRRGRDRIGLTTTCVIRGGSMGGGGGGRTRRPPPPLKLEKNMICWRKITKYPKYFRASLRSAQFF